jgi:hypothetical protein
MTQEQRDSLKEIIRSLDDLIYDVQDVIDNPDDTVSQKNNHQSFLLALEDLTDTALGILEDF